MQKIGIGGVCSGASLWIADHKMLGKNLRFVCISRDKWFALTSRDFRALLQVRADQMLHDLVNPALLSSCKPLLSSAARADSSMQNEAAQ